MQATFNYTTPPPPLYMDNYFVGYNNLHHLTFLILQHTTYRMLILEITLTSP